jgi:hypothetical protein
MLDMLRKRINKTKSVDTSAFVSSKMYFSQHMNRGKRFALYAKTNMLRKRINKTKSVEASAFVSSKMYFSQHMNRGKRFALYGLMYNV